MKINKVTECDKVRIPLGEGDVDGRKFTVSIFIDGTGCILEFDDKKYILKTEEIVAEILKGEK